MADSPTQLDAWLKGFPRDEVEGRIEELEHELDRWRKALALHNSLGSTSNGSDAMGSESEQPPNRPEAIRAVLRQAGNHPTTPSAIKDSMIERGWLKDEQKHLKRFYSAMYTMTKRGHLLRLHDGRYMLPQGALGDGMT